LTLHFLIFLFSFPLIFLFSFPLIFLFYLAFCFPPVMQRYDSHDSHRRQARRSAGKWTHSPRTFDIRIDAFLRSSHDARFHRRRVRAWLFALLIVALYFIFRAR
jgi:hypothetical protein